MTRKKDHPGFTEKAEILKKYLPEDSLCGMWDLAKQFKCNPDDLLDAACLAVTAALSVHDMCETIPEKPDQDDSGLCMMMDLYTGAIKKLC